MRKQLLCVLLILASVASHSQGVNEDSLYVQAVHFLNSGQVDSAKNILQRLLSMYPKSAKAYNLRGAILTQQGEYDQAIEMFRTCIRADLGLVKAVAAIYAVNGTHTYALGFTHRGRLEIGKGLNEQFAGPMKGTRIAITPLHIRSLSPHVAVEEASFSLSGLKDAGGKALPPVNGLCLGIYQQEGGQWYAVAVQCMVPPPPPR